MNNGSECRTPWGKVTRTKKNCSYDFGINSLCSINYLIKNKIYFKRYISGLLCRYMALSQTTIPFNRHMNNLLIGAAFNIKERQAR